MLWAWIDAVLKAHKLPPLKKHLPFSLAYCLGACSEVFSSLWPTHPEPLLTRFLASEMAKSHYFNISRARDLLGYVPKYSMREAMQITFGAGFWK